LEFIDACQLHPFSTMKIQHILVPVDFSQGTQAAIDYAREMAGRFSARLTLFHVLEPVFPPVSEVAFTFEEQARQMQEEAGKQLLKLAGAMAPGVQVDTAQETGVPWDCIVTHAQEQGIDLIIMATHGRSGLKHLWLGSVAERVVQHAPCAVLVARERPALNP
jgi:nucleotide-binding universal stress UspA family protein